MKRKLTSFVYKESYTGDDGGLVKKQRKASVDTKFRVHTPIGVDVLACLFRFLTEAKVFQVISKEALFRFVANYFSTSHSGTFTSASFRSRFYNNQTRTLLEIRNIAQEMLERVDEELRKCKR